MPFQKGHKYGGGKNSGRPSAKDEYTREEMVIKAIGKWAKAVRSIEGLTDKQVERYQKLIMPIVSKAMPTEVKGGITLDKVLGFKMDDNNDKANNKTKDSLEDTTE